GTSTPTTPCCTGSRTSRGWSSRSRSATSPAPGTRFQSRVGASFVRGRTSFGRSRPNHPRKDLRGREIGEATPTRSNGLAGAPGALGDLLESALVADATAQIALVSGVEPDRDKHGAARRWRLHHLRILESGGDASIRDRCESFRVCCPLGSGVRLLPATNLGVDLLPVLAPDPMVDRPAVL